MPETISTPSGVKFRPNLLATTSFDGSTATTYKRTVTDTVCDNTRELALSEVGQEFRVKHSRNSRLQLAPAREALAMVHTMSEDFAAEVAQLCGTPVSGAQWRQFLDEYVPQTDSKTGKPLEGRARTTAATKRDRLDQLYRYDPRVSPWEGSAHGVLQAVNTYEHHESVVRGDRAERNSLKTISGDFGQLDRRTWQTLQPLLLAARARPVPMRDVRGWWRRCRPLAAAVVAWQHAVRSGRAALDAANRPAPPPVALDGPELVLAVAEVFPHEFGQQLWWESYQRRTPPQRRELVADLRRRQTRNATGP